MKKIALITIVGLIVMIVAGLIAFQTIAAKEEASKVVEVSPKAARSLQEKIDAIRDAEIDHTREAGSSRLELTESELESYLLYSLREEIPAKIDSADVQLGVDTVSLDTQITFPSNATGNPVTDVVVGGTHNLFVKGRFVAQESQGKFDLHEVRVDGIPVPNVLIQALIKKYVNPKYPQVDLNAPFEMPWGIEALKLEPGEATVLY